MLRPHASCFSVSCMIHGLYWEATVVFGNPSANTQWIALTDGEWLHHRAVPRFHAAHLVPVRGCRIHMGAENGVLHATPPPVETGWAALSCMVTWLKDLSQNCGSMPHEAPCSIALTMFYAVSRCDRSCKLFCKDLPTRRVCWDHPWSPQNACWIRFLKWGWVKTYILLLILLLYIIITIIIIIIIQVSEGTT